MGRLPALTPTPLPQAGEGLNYARGWAMEGMHHYLVMSTSFVSRRNSEPITKVISANTIGYHRPE